LPAVRTYALVLTPVPLLVAALRGGGIGVAASLGVCALVLATTAAGEDVPAWAFVIGYGGIVGFIVLALRFAPGMNFIMVGGMLMATMLGGVHTLVAAQRHGRTVKSEYEAMVSESTTALNESLAAAQVDADRQEQFERMLPVVAALIPAMLVGQYATGLALGCWAALFVARRWRLTDAPRFDFAAWRLPEWFVFVFIVPAAALLVGLVRDMPPVVTAAGNGVAAVVLLYMLQGCAILHAFLRRFRVHPGIEAVIFLSMVVVLPPLLMMVAIAGLFDFLVDFRGRWMPAPPAADGPQ